MHECEESCNCAWKYCPSHPNGALCTATARGFSCDCEDHENNTLWLGNGTLGQGVRLCLTCADAIAQFLQVDIMKYMAAIADQLSPAVKCLTSLLRRHFLASSPFGSEYLVDEHMALMEFVNAASHLPDSRIPDEALIEGIVFAVKLRSLKDAFMSVDLAKVMTP